jgi:hypothetical protein
MIYSYELMIGYRFSDRYHLICLMAESSKYATVSKMLTLGSIESLKELFDLLPTTKFSREAGTSPERLGRMLSNPLQFKYQDIFKMAQVLQCDAKILNELVLRECLLKQQKKKR